ncbi:2-dehydropantoate 2-reductase [Hydrogenophaga sp. 5NK40-0174]|uniref:2-dehydropantoate 2-reductase n=1 Tax=Hydrogenophaga sp. 5NK40-0174 TaxID=3127649 RepID=UPI003109F734
MQASTDHTHKSSPSVLIMGAGSVGCYVGACLQTAGARVQWVGRPRVVRALQEQGLRITDMDGRDAGLKPSELVLHTQVPKDIRFDLVLLCVKSGATQEAARQLADALPAQTPVLSLQNGIDNADRAQLAAPSLHVIPAMVPFNIAALSATHFHRGTTGRLAAESAAGLKPWQPIFERSGLGLDLHSDLAPVQWGKLLLNLNNPVNALSGLPLRAQLLQREHRLVFAGLMEEALDVLTRAGIAPAQLTPLPWRRLVQVLRLPNWLFRLVAARMLRIDEHARSSMADDLAAGRRTEIDALCGAVVALASSTNDHAPRNADMVGRIHAAEAPPG